MKSNTKFKTDLKKVISQLQKLDKQYSNYIIEQPFDIGGGSIVTIKHHFTIWCNSEWEYSHSFTNIMPPNPKLKRLLQRIDWGNANTDEEFYLTERKTHRSLVCGM